MTTTSADILTAVYNALATQGGSVGQFIPVTNPVTPANQSPFPTIAGARIYMPRDWPVPQGGATGLGQFIIGQTGIGVGPLIKLQNPAETKDSTGKAGINFTTTTSIEVIGEVSRPAAEDDQGAGKVLTALWAFQREIEMAVIGDPVLFGGAVQGLIQQLNKVDTQFVVNADGTLHRGAVSMIFEFNFFQGTEDFQQPIINPIDRFHIFMDLINVDDPTGTYIPPPEIDYTPTPAPRTEGPDGRIEGEAEIIPNQ